MTRIEELLESFHEIPCYVAIALYFLGGLICLVLTVRSKAWFMLVVTVVAWLEAAGFGFRLAVIYMPVMGIYVGMQCLLIITPVLLPLVNYIVVGRLILLGDATWLPVRPVWVARCFTSSDIFCLILQGAGGSMLTSANLTTRKLGTNVLLAGLFLQLSFFTCFTALTLWVQHSKAFGLQRFTLRRVYFCLYSTIALLYIRNIFRIAEFLQGYDGSLASHEVFFYVFDFAMICGSVYIYCIFHFGYNMPQQPSDPAVSKYASSVAGPVGKGKGKVMDSSTAGSNQSLTSTPSGTTSQQPSTVGGRWLSGWGANERAVELV